MHKKQHFPDHQWSGFKKLLLVMKLTTFLLFLSVIGMAANTYAQGTKFDLNVKNATVIQVFDEIERVTEFGFLFKTDQMDLSKHYTLDIKDANIEKILDEVLSKDQYSYNLIDKNIVITKVSASAIQDEKSVKVSGKVTDKGGLPIPGTTVVVKGTTTGVITDANGTYSLSNIPANATLQFSFVGMKTQEVKVGNQTVINVVVEEESIGIEEVVAIGYGVQRKSDLAGSVGIANADQILKYSSFSALQGLKGSGRGKYFYQFRKSFR